MEEKKREENSNGMNWLFSVVVVVVAVFHVCDFCKTHTRPPVQTRGTAETSRVRLDQMTAERSHCATPC